MFGRKSNPTVPKRSAGKKSLAQFGLMDMPGIDVDDDFNNDEDLEAELLALTSEMPVKSRKPSRPVVDQSELNKMIKDSLRDIPSDEDVSSGEDDPSILAELQELQVEPGDKPVEVTSNLQISSTSIKSTLIERLRLYEIAEQNAKAANDSSKARRMNRGVLTLKDLIKQVDAGRVINEDDIPPVVSAGTSKSVPAIPPRPDENQISGLTVKSVESEVNDSDPPPIPPRTIKHSVPSSSEDTNDEPELKMKPSPEKTSAEPVTTETKTNNEVFTSDLDILKQRQNEYKKAALDARKNNDMQSALNYVKIVKQFDAMIQTITEGSSVDISSIPPSPVGNTFIKTTPDTVKYDTNVQQTLSGSSDPSQAHTIPSQSSAKPYAPPKTVMEALEQRLKKYQEAEEAAKLEENSSKVRRMGRIVTQYKNAIQLHKAGKPIPVDELPTPPGFAPIPVDGPPKVEENSASVPPLPAETKKNPAGPTLKASSGTSGRTSGAVSRNEKQLQVLLQRQKLFKMAALKAKQEGDLELAKEHLKSAKGFDPLIEASKCGLPVDLSSLPLAPNEKQALESNVESSYEVVRLNDCIEGSDLDVFHKLQTDLQHQLEICMRTRDHFKAMGDVANANRLEHLASQTKKDLKFVKLAESSNLRIPKFHYETKLFDIVQCNTDLTDNDVEVTIVQGINYNVPNPKSIDTYVKLTFPYPTDTPQQYKTAMIYDTNNPTYNSTTTFTIQRNARACKRVFLRNALKCEIWSKGGFLRSDTLLGTVNVKLQPLETQCTLHDAYDLMDGRRTVGGKLEVKIKLRDPIAKKQVERVEEKWLVIDS